MRKNILSLTLLLICLAVFVSGCSTNNDQTKNFSDIFQFILVGFAAQLIDGALGMAYGVSSNSFLLSLGLPPALASASVHTAEVFTTAISGASHWKLRNIDIPLAKKLIIPGVIGGVLGATILSNINGDVIKPWIAIYLLIMGLNILYKAFKRTTNTEQPKRVRLLGLTGGFLDAIGGGGWGPVVTSTLVARGHTPRVMIGTVNFSEFFVTFAESIAFLLMLDIRDNYLIVIGLLIGGAIAAPLAAIFARKVKPKYLMILIGIVIIFLSIRTMVLAWS